MTDNVANYAILEALAHIVANTGSFAIIYFGPFQPNKLVFMYRIIQTFADPLELLHLGRSEK